jgi:hypothetical protein
MLYFFKNKKKSSLMLDQIRTAVAAYSTRKLKSTASKAIRVRRSSDNAELDIGFVGNNLDIASLSGFIGAESGYISKWYDQSGYGNDAVQATAGNQPRIVDSGTIDVVNSKPALYFEGTSNRLAAAHSSSVNLQNPSVAMVQKGTRAAGAATEILIGKVITYGSNTGWGVNLRTSNPKIRLFYFGTSAVLSGGTPADPRDGNNHHIVGIKNSGNILIYENGSNVLNETYTDQTIANSQPITIGCDPNSGTAQNFYQGYFQEIILFSSDIQNNIPTLYNDSKLYYGVV